MPYSYKRLITLGAATGADQANFPVLIKLDSSNTGTTIKTVANGGRINNTVTQSGGCAVTMPADLVFTSDSGGTTLIPWEVDFYDGTAGELWVWVKVASLTSGSNAAIYMFYGDAAVTTQQNTGSRSPSNVWDSDFAGVWHMSESASPCADSTSGTGDAAVGASGSFAQSGKIGKSVSLNGTDGSLAANVDMSPYNVATYELWVNGDFTTDSRVISGYSWAGVWEGFWISTLNGYWSGGVKKTAIVFGGSSTNGRYFDGITDNTWAHIAVLLDQSQTAANEIKVYLNGVLQSLSIFAAYSGNASFANFDPNNKQLHFGKSFPASSYWNGKLDEVRISKVLRSENWLLTTYANQNDPLGFNTIGAEQSSSNPVPIFYHQLKQQGIA